MTRYSFALALILAAVLGPHLRARPGGPDFGQDPSITVPSLREIVGSDDPPAADQEVPVPACPAPLADCWAPRVPLATNQRCLDALYNCANRLAGCDLPPAWLPDDAASFCTGIWWHPEPYGLDLSGQREPECLSVAQCWGGLDRLRRRLRRGLVDDFEVPVSALLRGYDADSGPGKPPPPPADKDAGKVRASGGTEVRAGFERVVPCDADSECDPPRKVCRDHVCASKNLAPRRGRRPPGGAR